MSKLLVPFDGSENSKRALLHAIQWVRAQQTASIHVVHAHEEPDIYGEIAVYVSSEKMAALQRQMSEALPAGRVHGGASHPRQVGVPKRREDDSGTDGAARHRHGLAHPGLLAQVLVAEYLDHLPLYRQETIFERAGHPVARSTLA